MSNTSSSIPFATIPLTEEQVSTPVVPVVDEATVKRQPPDPTRYGDWEKNGRCIDFCATVPAPLA